MPTFTSGNDTYTVNSAGTYNLDLLEGDDRLNVYAGDSVTAHMGAGNDLVVLKAALNTIYGDAGADRFDVYVANAILDGGADNDTFNIRANVNLSAHGGLGADRFNFYADALDVSLYGDDGNDTFYGYNHTIAGNVYGGVGNDYFVQFGNRDGQVVTLYGGLGNDIYRADASSPATFVENALEGTDTVQVARGASYTLPTNIENISVQGFSGSSSGTAATLTGNASNNSIVAHNNVETIYGLDGNDKISAKGGDDTLHGGIGNDYLDGGTGNDTIYGNAGNDTLQGRGGDDTMVGGTGDDVYYIDSYGDVVGEYVSEGTDLVRVITTIGGFSYTLPDNVENIILSSTMTMDSIHGNALANSITGGAGSDYLYGDDGADTIKGGAGWDNIYGENGNDNLQGGSGTDWIEGGIGNDTIDGGDDGDIVLGGDGLDTVYGGAGDDQVSGDANEDIVDGGAGNDLVRGGGDSDTLTGGSGEDTFYYGSTDDSHYIPDQITDFLSVSGTGGDKFDFSAIDADTATAGDQAFAYSTNVAAAHSIWYGNVVDNGDGTYEVTVYGDVNGDTNPELTIQVHFLSPGLYSDDLIL